MIYNVFGGRLSLAQLQWLNCTTFLFDNVHSGLVEWHHAWLQCIKYQD